MSMGPLTDKKFPQFLKKAQTARMMQKDSGDQMIS